MFTAPSASPQKWGVVALSGCVNYHYCMAGNNELLIKWLTGQIKPSVFTPIHHATHEGKAFLGSVLFSGTASGADAEVLLIGGSIENNFLYTVVSGGDVFTSLIENPTVTASGTLVPFYNRDRESSKTTEYLLYANPTVSSGTYISNGFIAGGSGPQAAGGELSSDDEWLLNPEKSYVLRVKNITNTTQHIYILVELYSEVGMQQITILSFLI